VRLEAVKHLACLKYLRGRLLEMLKVILMVNQVIVQVKLTILSIPR
jgi:hypothetical protein